MLKYIKGLILGIVLGENVIGKFKGRYGLVIRWSVLFDIM